MSLQVELCKRFSDFTLEVAFETQEGTLGLLGASGSGKSMTLRCIAGIVRPDSGKILLNGKTLFDSAAKIDLPPQKRRVGLLFQNYALFPKMTAAQNVAAGIKRRDGRAAMVTRLLTLMRLEELAERYPHQLSGGQQQRVALARMLASEPEVLLFDEPFSALDGQLRHTIEPEFRQALAAANCPAVYVSHSVSEIYRFCDQTAALVEGHVAECAETKTLFAAPEQVATARLLCVRNLAAMENPNGAWADVPDWGMRLHFPKPTAGYAFAGVHADDLTFCAEPGENCVPVTVEQVEERPRYLAVTVRTKGAAKSLRVNCPREHAAQIAAGNPPMYLSFRKLLQLKDGT